MHGGEGEAAPQLEELVESIERYCWRTQADRPAERLGDELIALRRALDLLELEFARSAASFAGTNEYHRQGSVTPIDWVRHNCRMSGHAAADRVCVGEQMDRLPLSTGAMAAGEVGFAHLSLIAHTARALTGSSTAARPFDEGPLLELARESSVGRFRHQCHHVRHAGDPEGFAAEQEQTYEARRLELHTCEDGAVSIRGLLDPVAGTALRTALEPLARPTGRGDHRLRAQRFADANGDVAVHALDTGRVPGGASQRAHLQVTTSLETLRGLAGAPAAELELSLPISAKTVERLACDCTITRVLLGADSAVIDVGRSRRVVSGPTRRALNVRDGGCRWPGCDRPASWSEAHHVLHWVRGGGTDLENLVLVCTRHHRMLHEGGWQIVLADDGRVLTVPPPLFPHLARGPDAVAA